MVAGIDWNVVTALLTELESVAELTFDLEDVSVDDGYEVEDWVVLVAVAEDDVDVTSLGENEM